jgi:hypothetical protein
MQAQIGFDIHRILRVFNAGDARPRDARRPYNRHRSRAATSAAEALH